MELEYDKEMRFVLYSRKSTESDDRQALSLDSQESELKAIARTHGLNVVAVLKESKSAKEPGRPVFNEMIKMITSGKADAILCWKVDRLTRNPIDSGQIQWLLQNNKIKCIRTFEKSFLPNDNVLLMSLEQAQANQYIRDLSVNVKRGNRAKLARGDWPNKAPFGYSNDKLNKTIVVDPKNSKYVRRAFELYATGSNGFEAISNILYSEGLRNGNNNKIPKSSVQKILLNIFYTGIMVRDGKYFKGNHQPLISQATFNQAQAVAENRLHPKPKKLFFPLRGFLKCENCGCMFTASLKRGHQYYYCTNGKKICSEHKSYIRAEDLNKIASEVFKKLYFTERKIDLMYEGAKEKTGFNENYTKEALQTLQMGLESLILKESKLLDAFLAEQITKELYDQKNIEIKNERLILEKQIEGTQKEQPVFTLEQVRNVFIEANISSKEFLGGDDAKKREVAEKLLWNMSMKDKNIVSYQFKSPYDILAKVPQNAELSSLLGYMDSNHD